MKSKEHWEYTKGFNDGYLVARHNPDHKQTIEQLSKTDSNDYINGLVDGVEQSEKELYFERMGELGKMRDEDKGKDRLKNL